MKLRLFPLVVLGGFVALPWVGDLDDAVRADAVPADAVPMDFVFYQEFYGPTAHTDPQIVQNLADGMMNGVTLSTPAAEIADLGVRNVMLRLPGSAGPAQMSGHDIERERNAWNTQAGAHPDRPHFWNLMPEWDQSGGAWVAEGRSTYTDLSRAAALERFRSSFAERHPEVLRWLAQPREERKYRLAAVTDYPSSVHVAYDMGVELQLLERGIDELGDLSTGIAFLRGAARQHDRPWGIDLSSWRTGNERATEFAANGTLTGGWSASYLRRHYYASYLSGANVLHNEAVNYRFPDGTLNPLGEATREFADFALWRHPDLGQREGTIALLVPHNHGFDPKHGLHNQQNAVWYQDLPYSEGDHMLNNLLREAYPNHWLQGLAPGAPFLNRSGSPDPRLFRAFLAAGNDPRPFEPMATTRWGDNLDILTDQAPAAALARYQVIVLVGDVHFNATRLAALQEWVRRGGELVMFAGQDMPEPQFELPMPGASDAPSVTIPVGTGVVHFVTAKLGQSADKRNLLPSTVALLDQVILNRLPASVEGPPLEYVVNQSSGKVVVGLLNHASSEWTGRVVFKHPDAVRSVAEYVHDQQPDFSQSGSRVIVPVQIPPFDVRVIAVE